MKRTCSLATMNSWLVMFLTLTVLASTLFGIRFVQQYIDRTARHAEVRSEIENMYYYLKKEPTNLELFTVLRDGDSVSLSVWHNYLGTAEDIIKKYAKNLQTYETDQNYNLFQEVKLIPSLRKILVTFMAFQTENQERVEIAKSFSKEDFEKLKQTITEQLKQFIIEAKDYKFDLR